MSKNVTIYLMNLRYAAPGHLEITFIDAKHAKRVRPAVYGEIEGRENREAFSREVNEGLKVLRTGDDHASISATVPLDRLGPINRYVHVLAERSPDPAVQGQLYETYAMIHEFTVSLRCLEQFLF